MVHVPVIMFSTLLSPPHNECEANVRGLLAPVRLKCSPASVAARLSQDANPKTAFQPALRMAFTDRTGR